ncbi:TerD family protein [Deinococcus soli (ex Cha et al. 2016)]|uniref:Tellurite resistance protein TerA n=2 Tax=Deinococcus soli (ex Cha et al. 2016) TaxID=1309411 RepID=A0ACC6KG18_9DEIO|nr:TerD family protein [Deinococcus soli (ex Cha et al. 2016)]MDR6218361.1 tellurite resistance protein TerA [Deinococcus soli (ex Cha et al. 2016)]MDR6329101.1 tellurite resistance protein TerA [Deinococcus soli (ex Cha et al. 2016)]MDR6751374.1 tellurite resistance protein TerA [Deinococcus soli (ex Cha et al. 2016)]
MTQLQRGQRTPLAQIINANTFELRVTVQGNAHEYDVACFVLGDQDKVLSDDHVVFYNQRRSPDGAVEFSSSSGSGRTDARFTVNLAAVDHRVHAMVVTVTPDGGDLRGVTAGTVSVMQGAETRATFAFTGTDFTTERAIMAVQLYKRGGEWRLYVNGQGFAGGLDALVRHFGAAVAAPDAPRPVPAPAPTPAPTAPSVSLTKVTLNKQGDAARISLTKGAPQPVHVNLNWTQGRTRGIFGGSGASDLDLGCMLELEDGSKGVMQALGGNLGRKGTHPYIYVDKDDRSGHASDGENLYVEQPGLIRRVLIFAFIYEGTANFRDVSAHMTLRDTAGNEVKLNLDNPSGMARFCAVALLERQGDQLIVRKEEQYFRDHEDCDRHYRFGFNWRPGSK